MSNISKLVSFLNQPTRLSRVTGLLALLLLSSLLLAACGEDPTAPPSNRPVATSTVASAQTTSASSSLGSGISGQPAANGQPLPTPIPPGPDQRKVLTVWTAGWKGNADYEKFFNEQIDNYRQRNRQVTVDWQDWGGELAKKFEEAVAARTLPDIVLLDESDLYQFGASGHLADIMALGGSGLKEDYVGATFEALRYGSIYYGLPWLASTRVSIINKKLWQQASLDPAKTPRTFADLDPVLPVLAKNTRTDVRAAWVKPDPLVDFLMEDTPLYNVSGDGKSNQPNFPPNQPIERKWADYQDKRSRNKEYFDPEGLTKNYADALKKYTAGQLVMVLDGAPLLPGLKNASAELYNNTLVVPHVTGKANVLPLDIQGWAITKSSRQSAESLAFLKFLNSPENQLAFARFESLKVPTLKKALTDPYVTSQEEPLAQARSIMAATLDRTRPPEQLLPAPLKPADRERLLVALATAQTNIWTKGTLPKDALTEAAKVWNEVLK